MIDEQGGERAILDAVLDALERGRADELGALVERHPGHRSTVERVVLAARDYASVVRSLTGAPAPAPLLERGARLGDFEVEAPLARGGMGVVYRARHLSLGGRAVALKVHAVDPLRAQGLARFRREALALASLHHPHLAEVHGFGEQDGLAYLAMQLIEGPTLASAQIALQAQPGAARDPLLLRRLVGWCAEVADALAVVHDAGLVHRDVKPSNVVLAGGSTRDPLGAEARAVLVDFGLVRIAGAPALTRAGDAAATPAYAPREQLLGEPVGPRSDVFALGVTLHDLLSARLPAQRAQASAGLEPLRELAPHVDRDLAAIAARACEPEPRWRYADAGALGADLRAWLDGLPVSARRQPPLERARRWARRNPGAILRGGAAAAALVALLALAAWANGWREAAGQARAAFERGDLPALHHALAALPAVSDPLAFERGRVAAAAAAARRESAGGELLARALSGDDEGALLLSATRLARAGGEPLPLEERLLAAALGEAPPKGEGLALRARAALALAARLLHEQPIPLDGTIGPWGELTARLRSMWSWDGLAPADRLLLLSALNGCEELERAPQLLRWAVSRPRGSEDLRLGLTCVQRLLLRAIQAGRASEVPLDVLLADFLPQLHEVLAELDQPREQELAQSHGEHLAAKQLAHALILVARAQGSALEARRLLPPSWSPGSGGAPGALIALELLALCGDGTAREPLLRGELEGDALDGFWWGWCSAVHPDTQLGAAASAEALRREVQGFQTGARAGRMLLLGCSTEGLPDADTTLGWTDDPEDLAVARAAPDPGSTGAAWWLREDPPRLEGGAVALHGSACALALSEDGEPYLRFGRFGRSEVRLRFELAEADPHGAPALVLDHQIGLRNLAPFGGEVVLDVELDGRPIATGWQIDGGAGRCDRLPIHPLRLGAGPHELRIRQSVVSTTTWRLYRVAIER